jgi:hypothetical protein
LESADFFSAPLLTTSFVNWQHLHGQSLKERSLLAPNLAHQAEALAVLGAVAAVLQLSNTGLKGIRNLKDAYNHYHQCSTLFDRCQIELQIIKSLVKLVKNEPALHTQAIVKALNGLKGPEERLGKWLSRISTGNKSAVHSFLRELTRGSDNRKKLESIMMELDRAKGHLDSVIQIRHVGMSRKRDERDVANSKSKLQDSQKPKESRGKAEVANKAVPRRARTRARRGASI